MNPVDSRTNSELLEKEAPQPGQPENAQNLSKTNSLKTLIIWRFTSLFGSDKMRKTNIAMTIVLQKSHFVYRVFLLSSNQSELILLIRVSKFPTESYPCNRW